LNGNFKNMGYLGTQKVKKLILSQNVIEPNNGRVVCGAYELSLGKEVFRTDSPNKKKEFLKEKEQVVINPGQFALLLTYETVNIPEDKIAFISIKAGIKLKGLVNVSGFHVDPGYKGNLIFSVYNAGSSQISLSAGEPCFLIWFADLILEQGESSEYDKENHEHFKQDSIPTRYIDSLATGEIASPNILSKKIDDNQKELDKRISLIEKEQTAKDYLVKAAVGLGIIIVLKFVFDWIAYDNGFRKGYQTKQKEISADSITNDLLFQKKRLLIEIDSLTTVRDTLRNR